LHRNVISPSEAFLKTQKAPENALAEKVLLEKDLENGEAAEAVDQAARASKKRTRYPRAICLIRNTESSTHRSWLSARPQNSRHSRRGSGVGRVQGNAESCKPAQQRPLSPSSSVPSNKMIVCICD